MEKLLDAVIKIVPPYLLVAITGSAATFFAVHYWRGYRVYSDTVRDRVLWSVIIVIAAVVAIYAINVRRVQVREGNEPLVIIPYFRNDEGDQFRYAVGTQIEAALASGGSSSAVLYVDSFIADYESAVDTANRFRASGVIFGPTIIREKDETRCSFRVSTLNPAATKTYPLVSVRLPKEVIDDIVLSLSTAQATGMPRNFNPVLARLDALERAVSELRVTSSQAVTTTEHPHYSAKHALIVGVNAPEGAEYPSLASAESDALQVHDLLQAKGFTTQVVIGSRATRAAVLSRINEAAGRQSDELFLVYFAGHGRRIRNTRLKSSDGYELSLILHDSAGANASPPLRITELKMLMLRLAPSHKLVVLDTAYGTSGLDGSTAATSQAPGQSSVLQFLSGSQDAQFGTETKDGGVFTQNLLASLREAHVDTPLPALVALVSRKMAEQKAYQAPKLLTIDGTGTIYPLAQSRRLTSPCGREHG